MWSDLKPAYRFPILALGMIALFIATLAGLARLAVPVPQIALDQIANHGVLMVPVFFGTVIGLERAVAIGRLWSYLAPLATALAGIVTITNATPLNGPALLFLGSLVFLMASAQVMLIQRAVHNWILFAGALSLVVSNLLLLLGYGPSVMVYWWISFLLLTIAGERLELNRFVNGIARTRMGLVFLTLLPLTGALLELYQIAYGTWVFALGLAGIGGWLLRFDIAWHTVRMKGLTRFTAVCMLAGYFWLLVSALLFIANETALLNSARDPALHAFFLGFVFSMVLGHALIIFPAVTRLSIPYSALFYLPLFLLQLSVMLRIFGGLSADHQLLRYGAIANAFALALFILTLVVHIIRGRFSKTTVSAEQTLTQPQTEKT